jgi:hypothetical protein
VVEGAGRLVQERVDTGAQPLTAGAVRLGAAAVEPVVGGRMGAVEELVVLRRRPGFGRDQGPGAVEQVDADPAVRVAVKRFQGNLVRVFAPFESLYRVRAPSPHRVMVVRAPLFDLESRAGKRPHSVSPRA